MKLTAEQYAEAIEQLQRGSLQLEPDGGNCTVCGEAARPARKRKAKNG